MKQSTATSSRIPISHDFDDGSVYSWGSRGSSIDSKKKLGKATVSPMKRQSLGASHSSFAVPSWGKGNSQENSRVRVVVRIRPDERCEGDQVVFPFSDGMDMKDDTHTASTQATSPVTASPISSVGGSTITSPSVTSLAARFEESSKNSPSFIPVPGEITTPSKRINNYVTSPSKTPLHKNSLVHSASRIPGVITTPTKFDMKAMTSGSRPSFIQSPTTQVKDSKEEIDEKPILSTRKIMVGNEYPKEFEFDEVIDTIASQEEVYDRALGDAVRRNIFRGINTSVITYGQAESGKTFTMKGKALRKRDRLAPPVASHMRKQYSKESDDATISSYSDESSICSSLCTRESTLCTKDDGIIFRAINDIFMAKKRQATGGEVTINMSYFEVCDNEVKDLLVLAKRVNQRSTRMRDGKSMTSLATISSVNIKSSSQAKKMIDVASQSRKMKSYERAHVICVLKVTIHPALNSSVTLGKHTTATDVVTAKLTLVDLAGSSERIRGETNALLIRNLAKVKKDLFVLGQCISALSDEKAKKGVYQHIPWRDSKLTRLLKDSLCGNCCTVMIACISPLISNIEDTLNTLRYAERTKQITNKVSKNVKPTLALSPAEGAALRRDNKLLKAKVNHMARKMKFMRKYQHWESRALNPVVLDGDSVNPSDFEVKELKEQLQQLLNCSESDDVSVLSGLTTLTDDFYADDDISLDSMSTSSTSLFAHVSVEPKPFDHTDGVDCLDECLEAKLKQIKDLDNQLTTLKESNKQEMSAHEDRLEKVKKQCAAVVDEIRTYKNQVQSLKDERQKMQERKKEEIMSYENQLEKLKQQYVMIEATLDKMKLQVKQLTDEKHHLADEVEGLLDVTSLADELAAEQQHGEEKDKELIQSRSELRVVKEDRDALQRRLNQLERTFSNEKKIRESVEQNLKGLRLKVEEMEHYKTTIERRLESKPPLPTLKARPVKRQDDQTISSSISISGFLGDISRSDNCDGSSFAMSNDESFASYATEADSLNSDQLAIRSHAQKLLAWAERAEKQRVSSCDNSISSSLCSTLPPRCIAIEDKNGSTKENRNPNVALPPMKDNQTRPKVCSCGKSIFSGKDEHSEFFLPKLGLACKCGAIEADAEYAEPDSLTCYLRSWQVDFLSSVGINTTSDLVKGQKYNSRQLVKQMKAWRRAKCMKPARTKSCNIALHIWSKTAATAIQTNRRNSTLEQRKDGFSKPFFMEIDCRENHDDEVSIKSVSTIGNYSTDRQMETIGTEDPLEDGEWEI